MGYLIFTMEGNAPLFLPMPKATGLKNAAMTEHCAPPLTATFH